jgi:single-strand DNA-binding protein
MWTNSVLLVGRVTGTGEEIELPSGDTLTKFRVVVPREKPETKTVVDTIECVAFKPAIQKKVLKLEIDDVVEIEGSIRRRFWQGATGVASKVEVEVSLLKVIKQS